ncbi:hypothetical protein [Amycolatopsis rubida]|uniref:Uncharacterized protein n=1 Tax=Amycolatopsis rubida TaxID=112413 RepID=A0A1I5IYK3_9PSEU|nr:hypothetical protein [Amycolatopsis rubida]SFO65463.1 hypothetical protein SAMN05421854_102782 [Amycolatopsis rubida]
MPWRCWCSYVPAASPLVVTASVPLLIAFERTSLTRPAGRRVSRAALADSGSPR